MLKQRIAELISETGPISVSQYMAMCLFDPADGYYTTKQPFGAAGDFVTAPEISQMFGELVAVWLYSVWTNAGRPRDAIFAEIGPGRGTLMRDMVRTWQRLPGAGELALALIETSPRLAEIQRRTLVHADRVDWYREVAELPARPLFIVANELFDAIPFRQFVATEAGWRERCIGIDDKGELAFLAGAATIDTGLLPPGAVNAPTGSIFEVSPAREAMAQQISQQIETNGGAALFIDYGHLQSDLGDTLQALRRHAYDDVLAHPGEADLTSHVDFGALADAAKSVGMETRTMTQARFLLRMGLLERAGQLGASGSPELQARLQREVDRLASPDQMGELFKVLMIAADAIQLPAATD